MTTFLAGIGVFSCAAKTLGACDFPAWGPDRRFACIEECDPGSEECGIGCDGCSDGVGGIADGVRAESTRWMRNHPSQPSRSAYGDFRDLEAAHVRPGGGMTNVLLLPPGAHYQAAPCYRQTGHECFDLGLCGCYGDVCITVEEGETKCVRGEQVFDLSIGNMMTCHVNTGTKWHPSRVCAMVAGGPLSTRLFQTNPAFDVMNNLSVTLVNSDCAANMFINCTGKTQRSSCCGGPGGCAGVGQSVKGNCCEPLIGGPPDPCIEGSTYNPNGGHSVTMLRFIELRTLVPPALVVPDGAANDLQAVIGAKNRALERIVTRMFTTGPEVNQRVRFDQLDNQSALAFGFADRAGNEVLGQYTRNWRKPDGMNCAQMLALHAGDPLLTDSPLVMEMPNCHLKHSRHPVTAKLYLIDINFRAHFVIIPMQIDRSRLKRAYLPSVRVHIEGQLVTSAEFASGATPRMLRPWLASPDDDLALEIDNSNSCEGVLRDVRGRTLDGIDRGIVDEIVYVDDEGRRFVPPSRVHWWGYLGESSRPNRWQPTESGLSGDFCRLMRQQLSWQLLQTEGWPYEVDTNPEAPNAVYGGAVQFRFRQGL